MKRLIQIALIGVVVLAVASMAAAQARILQKLDRKLYEKYLSETM